MLAAQFLPIRGGEAPHARSGPSVQFPSLWGRRERGCFETATALTPAPQQRGCRGCCGGVPPPTCPRRLLLSLFEVHTLSFLHFLQALSAKPPSSASRHRAAMVMGLGLFFLQNTFAKPLSSLCEAHSYPHSMSAPVFLVSKVVHNLTSHHVRPDPAVFCLTKLLCLPWLIPQRFL